MQTLMYDMHTSGIWVCGMAPWRSSIGIAIWTTAIQSSSSRTSTSDNNSRSTEWITSTVGVDGDGNANGFLSGGWEIVLNSNNKWRGNEWITPPTTKNKKNCHALKYSGTRPGLRRQSPPPKFWPTMLMSYSISCSAISWNECDLYGREEG